MFVAGHPDQIINPVELQELKISLGWTTITTFGATNQSRVGLTNLLRSSAFSIFSFQNAFSELSLMIVHCARYLAYAT